MNQLIAQRLTERGRGSQSALADALGVRAQTVSKWVSGDVTPEPGRWPAIEAALDLDEGSLRAAHLAAITPHPADAGARIPLEVQVALQTLGAELVQLRAEVAELRAELHAPARSSDPMPPAPRPTPRP